MRHYLHVLYLFVFLLGAYTYCTVCTDVWLQVFSVLKQFSDNYLFVCSCHSNHQGVKLLYAPVRCQGLSIYCNNTHSHKAVPPSLPDEIHTMGFTLPNSGAEGGSETEHQRECTSCEMRWIFVYLTGNIQPFFFSVSETVVSASQHYCQADVWRRRSNFPSSC